MKTLILSALLLLSAPAIQAATICAGTISLTTSEVASGTVVTARYEEFPLFNGPDHTCTQYTGGIVWYVTYCFSWLDDNCDSYINVGPDSTPPSGVTISFQPHLPGIHMVTAHLVDLPSLTPDGTKPNPDRVKKVIWRQLGPYPPTAQRRVVPKPAAPVTIPTR